MSKEVNNPMGTTASQYRRGESTGSSTPDIFTSSMDSTSFIMRWTDVMHSGRSNPPPFQYEKTHLLKKVRLDETAHHSVDHDATWSVSRCAREGSKVSPSPSSASIAFKDTPPCSRSHCVRFHIYMKKKSEEKEKRMPLLKTRCSKGSSFWLTGLVWFVMIVYDG